MKLDKQSKRDYRSIIRSYRVIHFLKKVLPDDFLIPLLQLSSLIINLKTVENNTANEIYRRTVKKIGEIHPEDYAGPIIEGVGQHSFLELERIGTSKNQVFTLCSSLDAPHMFEKLVKKGNFVFKKYLREGERDEEVRLSQGADNLTTLVGVNTFRTPLRVCSYDANDGYAWLVMQMHQDGMSLDDILQYQSRGITKEEAMQADYARQPFVEDKKGKFHGVDKLQFDNDNVTCEFKLTPKMQNLWDNGEFDKVMEALDALRRSLRGNIVDVVGYMALLNVGLASYSSKGRVNFADKTLSRLDAIPHNNDKHKARAIGKIVGQYSILPDSYKNVDWVFNKDSHPQNWLIHRPFEDREEIFSIDFEDKGLVPIGYDLASLLTFVPYGVTQDQDLIYHCILEYAFNYNMFKLMVENPDFGLYNEDSPLLKYYDQRADVLANSVIDDEVQVRGYLDLLTRMSTDFPNKRLIDDGILLHDLFYHSCIQRGIDLAGAWLAEHREDIYPKALEMIQGSLYAAEYLFELQKQVPKPLKSKQTQQDYKQIYQGLKIFLEGIKQGV